MERKPTFRIGDRVEVVDSEDVGVVVRICEDEIYETEYLVRFNEGPELWYEESELSDPSE